MLVGIAGRARANGGHQLTDIRPTFSIVSAVCNVEPYLPDFIRSVERQAIDPTAIEVIAVDDGSTDGSLALLEAWRAGAPFPVTVLSQPNAGQAAARNAGLRRATGEWVTFTDPDDMLDPGFLVAAHQFAVAHPGVDVLGARVLTLDEARGAILNRHPRRRQFVAGDRVVDLEVEPTTFPGSAASSLFRADRIRELDLSFDELLRPNFEDQHLTARFVLGLHRPVVGILCSATYLYRRRRTDDSTMQRAYAEPGRYTTVLERGYLDLIERARTGTGVIPDWLAHLVLYELTAYFRNHDRAVSRIALPAALVPRFHELLAKVCLALDPALVERHSAPGLQRVWMEVVAHTYRHPGWRPAAVDRTDVDAVMGLQRIAYRYTGDLPAEGCSVSGGAVLPAFAKIRAVTYFDRPVLFERILWLPSGGDLDIRLDGRPVVIRDAPRDPPRRATPRRRHHGRRARIRAAVRMLPASVTHGAQRLLARTAYRWRFHDAWAVMDWISDAGDNGERLFEYLRRERPDINAWFVVDARCPAWDRLRAAGVRRLVAHGSFTWTMLMLNASWLLSSHADAPVVRPRRLEMLAGPLAWRYGFLQHGVIATDLSRWLNRKRIDLFVVSTEPELESIAGDGSSYTVTRKEVRLTGLPRFDRLLVLSREAHEPVTLVLVAPTWRAWLTRRPAGASSRREVSGRFAESEYARSWLALLKSSEITEAVRRRGWTLGFLPHPNMRQGLLDLDLPDHVEALTWARGDVQALFARTALVVTDYSSVAFDVAYLDRPVVYYQFDWARFASGRHTSQPGSFDFQRDGFGPVALDHDAAVAAIVAAIEYGPTPTAEYMARIAQTFPVRDGDACARVVAAVEEMSRPWVAPPHTETGRSERPRRAGATATPAGSRPAPRR